MKKMTRRFFCLFLSIILGFSATGCAKPDDGSTGENNNADCEVVQRTAVSAALRTERGSGV